MIKVTYIDHSGFLLELESCNMLFDYYRGQIPEMNPKKPLLVFASHNHHDHYNAAVLKLAEQYPLTKFIFSDDIPHPAQGNEKDMTFVSCDMEYDILISKNKDITSKERNCAIETLHLTTLKSTDEGVAFLIELNGKRYYHAGDLNLWIWEGETEPYNTNMEAAYYKELDKLRDLKIDIAFVPLDPRQEHNAELGLESYLEATHTKVVFPMHCWGKYEIISDFLGKEKHAKYRDIVKVIHRPGEIFQHNLQVNQ